MVLFMAALANIPREVIEAAELERATKWQIFFHLKLRYLSSSILFVTILSLINSFKIFREVYLLTGDYPYETLYMLQHYMNNMFRSLDYQKLSAAAILMSFVMIVLIGILFFAENVVGKDLDGWYIWDSFEKEKKKTEAKAEGIVMGTYAHCIFVSDSGYFYIM